MTELPQAPGQPPVTGEPDVDEVSRRVAEVADQPLSEHHDRLSRAHEELHQALQDEPGPAPVTAGPEGAS